VELRNVCTVWLYEVGEEEHIPCSGTLMSGIGRFAGNRTLGKRKEVKKK
jgi:hypothetical protein